ncbi:hypothetical protein GC197_08870 [bacterium]|nr:hypothetical protein [bacterium]
MSAKQESDKTTQRAQRIETLWSDIENKLEAFERDKEEFAKEFGVEFEQFVAYMSKNAKQARESADADMLADLDRKSTEIKRQFDEELAAAKEAAGYETGKQSGAKRARRMRDMI